MRDAGKDFSDKITRPPQPCVCGHVKNLHQCSPERVRRGWRQRCTKVGCDCRNYEAA